MKGSADLLKKWLNEESCVDKNYDELQKMEEPKIYTMSETYESYTADDYRKQGDIGPYFDVVPLHDYLALCTKLTELDELNTKVCVERDIASERVDELRAKLAKAKLGESNAISCLWLCVGLLKTSEQFKDKNPDEIMAWIWSETLKVMTKEVGE